VKDRQLRRLLQSVGPSGRDKSDKYLNCGDKKTVPLQAAIPKLGLKPNLLRKSTKSINKYEVAIRPQGGGE